MLTLAYENTSGAGEGCMHTHTANQKLLWTSALRAGLYPKPPLFMSSPWHYAQQGWENVFLQSSSLSAR